jgi:hypothetical protein
MRTMQAKVVDPRELWYSVESVLYVHDAIRYRVEDLTSMSIPPSISWPVDLFNTRR